MSDRTVYEELTRELNLFVKEHGLSINYDPINKERPEEWAFTIYSNDRSWGYRRLLSATVYEQSRLDPYHHANLVINDIRNKLKEKGVIA